LHDLQRVGELTKHFGIETLVCINKWDLNGQIASQIEAQARQRGLKLAGKVRYDRAVTEAQIKKQSLVEYQQDGAATEMRELWAGVLERVAALNSPATGDGS
jgi:MinD superfamily P-loop ATPase